MGLQLLRYQGADSNNITAIARYICGACSLQQDDSKFESKSILKGAGDTEAWRWTSLKLYGRLLNY